MACKKCNEPGHNAVTCGREKLPVVQIGELRDSKQERFKVNLEKRHPGMLAKFGKESDSEIGRQYGLTRSRVHQLRNAAGLPVSTRDLVTLASMKGAIPLIGVESDRNVARQTGVSVYAVRKIRKGAGLITPRQQVLNKIKANETLLGTMSDAALAEKLMVSVTAVYNYRRTHQIEANSPPPTPKRATLNVTREQMEEMLGRGMTLGGIARELNCSKQTLARIRQDLGMAAHPHVGKPAKHPWGLWTDGNVHEVVKGKEFDCNIWSFSSCLRARARKMGLGVRVRVKGEHVTFWFCAKDSADLSGADEEK